MVLFVDTKNGVEVDLRIAVGDPEATIIDAAPMAIVFGVTAPVATLEHLLMTYLYSNQPKHIGDLAAIVQSGRADLAQAERMLDSMHPEMLADWHRRVTQANRHPRRRLVRRVANAENKGREHSLSRRALGPCFQRLQRGGRAGAGGGDSPA